MNLRSEAQIINMCAVNHLEMEADQPNNKFYVRSLFANVQDTVYVSGNARYLCFGFRGKGQQIKIQQI